MSLVLISSYGGLQIELGGHNGGPVHMTVTLPTGKTLPNTSNIPVAISPDGSVIVYSAYGEDRKTQLYSRKLGSFQSAPIAGTEGARGPFFSPSGEWVAFINDDGKLEKVSLLGGSAVVLADQASLSGAWADDDTIYYLQTFASGLYAVPAGGGQPRRVTQPGLTPDDRAHVWPSVLPGGNGLIFTVWTGRSFNDAKVWR